MGIEQRANGRWRASVGIKHKTHSVGVYDTAEEARAATEAEYARIREGTSVLTRATRDTVTIKEFAADVRIRLGTLRRWVTEGMPVERLGRSVCVKPEAAREWIAHRYPQTIATSRRGMLYMAERANDNAVKIGWSSDVERRMRELRRDTGSPIVLLLVVPGDKPEELALHERFSGDRIVDEWFRQSDALMSFIESFRGRAA
jgi:hypothetical protein